MINNMYTNLMKLVNVFRLEFLASLCDDVLEITITETVESCSVLFQNLGELFNSILESWKTVQF